MASIAFVRAWLHVYVCNTCSEMVCVQIIFLLLYFVSCAWETKASVINCQLSMRTETHRLIFGIFMYLKALSWSDVFTMIKHHEEVVISLCHEVSGSLKVQ